MNITRVLFGENMKNSNHRHHFSFAQKLWNCERQSLSIICKGQRQLEDEANVPVDCLGGLHG